MGLPPYPAVCGGMLFHSCPASTLDTNDLSFTKRLADWRLKGFLCDLSQSLGWVWSVLPWCQFSAFSLPEKWCCLSFQSENPCNRVSLAFFFLFFSLITPSFCVSFLSEEPTRFFGTAPLLAVLNFSWSSLWPRGNAKVVRTVEEKKKRIMACRFYCLLVLRFDEVSETEC